MRKIRTTYQYPLKLNEKETMCNKVGRHTTYHKELILSFQWTPRLFV